MFKVICEFILQKLVNYQKIQYFFKKGKDYLSLNYLDLEV